MGFEIMAIVPILAENAKTDAEKLKLKTRVALIRTAGAHKENHITAFLLMQALGYDIEERCPEALEAKENLMTGDMEYEFEGCGEIVEYTTEELVAVAKSIEETVEDPSQKKVLLKFIDKTIEALDLGGWDKAEIGFF